MSDESKEEILGAIAGVSKAVVELSIEMNRRFKESEEHHQKMLNKLKKEIDKRFKENDKHHEEMMTEMNRRFDKNDEDHKYINLAIDTLGILSKENDIEHTEYNKRLDIKRVKFNTQ